MRMQSRPMTKGRPMNPMAWPALLALVIGGCAAPGPADTASGATGATATGAASAASPAPPAKASWSSTAPSGPAGKFAPADVAPKADESWSIEARVVLQAVPEGPTAHAARTLKTEYPSKAALVEAIKEARPGTAVELDGVTLFAGFGPALRFRTEPDGTVRR